MDNKSLDTATLSDGELKKIRSAATKELQKRDAEKQRLEDLRKNYTLCTPQREYTKYHQYMWKYLKKHIEEHGSATLEDFEQIEARNTHEIPYNRYDVYPCPKCGNMSLDKVNWGDEYRPKYSVVCRSCDWSSPKSKYSDVWDQLHEWLIKHGYLAEGIKSPR